MTEDWDPALRELATEYSPGYVLTAFAVRESIAEEGYPGIHFTEKTEDFIEREALLGYLERTIEREMNKELRHSGFK
jgi:hypothetical protein